MNIDDIKNILNGRISTEQQRITKVIICCSLIECIDAINPDIITHFNEGDMNTMYDLIMEKDICNIMEKACRNDYYELFCLLCSNEKIMKRFNESAESTRIMICAPINLKRIYLYYNSV